MLKSADKSEMIFCSVTAVAPLQTTATPSTVGIRSLMTTGWVLPSVAAKMYSRVSSSPSSAPDSS